jgi:hypothetical protein
MASRSSWRCSKCRRLRITLVERGSCDRKRTERGARLPPDLLDGFAAVVENRASVAIRRRGDT